MAVVPGKEFFLKGSIRWFGVGYSPEPCLLNEPVLEELLNSPLGLRGVCSNMGNTKLLEGHLNRCSSFSTSTSR